MKLIATIAAAFLAYLASFAQGTNGYHPILLVNPPKPGFIAFNSAEQGTNGFLFLYRSYGPITLLDPSKADLVTNGITFKQIVDALGPGWMSPSEGIGYISWTFKDGRELKVRPVAHQGGSMILTTNRMRWLTNQRTNTITRTDPQPKPRYLRIW